MSRTAFRTIYYYFISVLFILVPRQMRKLFGHRSGKAKHSRDFEVFMNLFLLSTSKSLTSSHLGDTKTIYTYCNACIPEASDIWPHYTPSIPNYTIYRRGYTITITSTPTPTASHNCSIPYTIFQLTAPRHTTNTKCSISHTKIRFSYSNKCVHYH